MALEALHRENTLNVGSAAFREWSERADRSAAGGTSERAYADIAMGRVLIAQRRRAAGVELLQGALRLARTLDDPELLFSAAWQNMRNLATPENWAKAEALAAEFNALPRRGVSTRTVAQTLEFCGVFLLSQGNRDGAEAAWNELSQLADRSRDASIRINAMTFQTVMAVLDGRLEEAVATGTRAADEAQALGTGVGILGRGLTYATQLRGLSLEPLDWGAGFIRVRRLAIAGRHEEAQAGLTEELENRQLETGEIDPHSHPFDLTFLLEAALTLEDADALRLLVPALRHFSRILDPQGPSALSRQLGEAAVLLGQPAEARAYYEQAIDICTRVKFRPELALTRLLVAELLLAHYPQERPAAIEHLDFAIAEFRDMKMQPALRRALRHKDVLTA